LERFKEEVIQEKVKETLRTWFSRKGAPGKKGGWVDCNTCREKMVKQNVKLVVEKKEKHVQNILHVALQRHNVKHLVKVKNGEKQND
jgi:hypothetical protein